MKCPACSTDGAYVGFATVECANRSCHHFVPTKTPVADLREIDRILQIRTPFEYRFCPLWLYMPSSKKTILINLE